MKPLEQLEMEIREWKDELEDAIADCNREAAARARRKIKKLTEAHCKEFYKDHFTMKARKENAL
jgi:protein-arginine kinase activator protein McsA